MIELTRLKLLISNLSLFEKHYIYKSLSNGNSDDVAISRSVTLFNILLTDSNLSITTLSLEVYGIENLAALRKLMQRLIDRLLEILCSKEVVIENEVYGNRAKQVFIIRRKLFHYDILLSHGLKEYAVTILDQVIALCIELEYFDYLIIAFNKKLIKMSLQYGGKVFNAVYNQMEIYSELNLLVKKSEYLLRMYSSNFEYKRKFLDQELDVQISNLELKQKDFKSRTLQINLFYLKAIQLFNNSQYSSAFSLFKKLYRFLSLNESLILKNSIPRCLFNLAECQTMLMNFDDSLSYLKDLVNYPSKNMYNNKMLSEKIFVNYFYSGNIKASALVLKDLHIETSGLSEFLISKWNYYSACHSNITYDFLASNKFLVKCHVLDNDKSGWNLGVRILSIINNIELNKLIFADSQIENLRKHIGRVRYNIDFQKRFELIAKLLVALSNNSFNFQLVNIKFSEVISKLRNFDSEYSWHVNSPEMIIFHEWFEAKAKNIPYDHVQVMKRLKKAQK